MTKNKPGEILKTLADLKPGQSAVIHALNIRGEQRRRLFDLGFIPGSTVRADLRAALGEPTAYRIHGALIALRADQAARIDIKEVQDA